MKDLILHRYSGAKNSFYILDNSDLSFTPTAEVVKKICRSQKKTDGFLCIEKSEIANFKWNFFNQDGSAAEMCGNAARCAAHFFFERAQSALQSITFETGAGLIKAERLFTGEITIGMPLPILLMRNLQIDLGSRNMTGDHLNTGVPHFVTQKEPDLGVAELILTHKYFQPQQTNVTFVKKVTDSAAEAVTYERGLNTFTSACGTGAVAAAISLWPELLVSTQHKTISMPGGNLTVFSKSKNEIWLGGPVSLDYSFIFRNM